MLLVSLYPTSSNDVCIKHFMTYVYCNLQCNNSSLHDCNVTEQYFRQCALLFY